LEINEKIKAVRDSLSLTQTDFGNKIGLKQNTVVQLEKGQRAVTDRTIILISQTFGVNEDWLRNGNGEMFNENDDTVIAAVVDEYKLDSFDEIILKAYIESPPEVRAGFGSFIKRFSRYVLENDVHLALGTAFNNIDNTYRGKGKSTGAVLENVKNDLEDAFSEVLPPARNHEKPADNPPPAAPSKLEVLKAGDEDLEKEAEEFAEMAKQQFLSEKRRELQASSAKESGAG